MARLPMLARALACAAALTACAGGGAVPSGTPGTAAAAVTSPSATPSPSSPTGPAPTLPPEAPKPGQEWFLAVGDSITAGFTLDPARAGVNSAWPLLLARRLAATGRNWQPYNLACSGERLETYRTTCPDRRTVATVLHGLSQERAALDVIAARRAGLRLILVDLGSNDLLDDLRHGASVAAAVATVRTQLAAVVAELQQAAPSVPVVIGNFYNPFENALPQSETQVAEVNAAVRDVVAARGAILADFHAAINGDPPPDARLCIYVDCAHIDIHPTVAGQQRLADTALAALG